MSYVDVTTLGSECMPLGRSDMSVTDVQQKTASAITVVAMAHSVRVKDGSTRLLRMLASMYSSEVHSRPTKPAARRQKTEDR